MEIGCGTGELLARLSPSRGVGIDFSPEMVRVARENFPPERYPALDFRVEDAEALTAAERFDYIVVSDLLGELTDVWGALRKVRSVVHEDSRLVVTCFNPLWEPVLRAGEALGLEMPQDHQNWLSLDDISNLLTLTGFEVIKTGYRPLLPVRVPLLNRFVRHCIAPLPGINRLGLLSYVVACPQRAEAKVTRELSVTVVVPCRNERGNIDDLVERVPEIGSHTEILFVDGNSNDGTVEAIEAAIVRFAGRKDIKLIHQAPRTSMDRAGHGRMLRLGKGDAVRKGFEAAIGDVPMILDADLTVPPEELPRFYLALTEGHGDFVNGSRLIYPMEAEAMRSLNKAANGAFGLLFSWLLGQRIKDTLCGTKVLRKQDYERLAAGRAYFWRFRSVWGLRPIVWRLEAKPEDRRDADSLP